MSTKTSMQQPYLTLALRRYACRPESFKNPEDLGFEFRQWISPYTKCAHTPGGIAVVLQDWGSIRGFEGLITNTCRVIQEHGRNPHLKTNVRLDLLLQRVFEKRVEDIYVTNAFPYIKSGTMSSKIPL